MRPLDLLHVDPHLLVVDKPAGLLSVPTPGASGRTLVDVLAEQGHSVLPVHRLDRDVSGCVLFALDEATRAALDQLFREREQGDYKDPILDEGAYARVSARGKRCHTRWRVTARHREASEVEIELVTGRYNQIRVHFAHHGHPLLGERKYARGKQDPFRCKRVALHAAHLEFRHPHGGALLEVQSPLPADLQALAARAAGGPSADARPDPRRRGNAR